MLIFKNKTLGSTPGGLLFLLFFLAVYNIVKLRSILEKPIITGVQPDYDDEGTHSVIKTIDLNNDYIDYDNLRKVSYECFNENSKSHVKKGDILISITGIGSMGKIDIYESEKPALISGEIVALRLKSGFDPYFICYYLRSYFSKVQFDKRLSGSSGQIHIYSSDINQFYVPSNDVKGVPYEKQQDIAFTITQYLSEAREAEEGRMDNWSNIISKMEEFITGYLD